MSRPFNSRATQVRDLDQWIQFQNEHSFVRLVAALFTGFSLLCAGIESHRPAVAQRTNEFGLRMALGVTRPGVVPLVLASTAREVAGGLAGGILLSLLLGRLLSRWAEASVQNPFLFAAFIPARRASSVDPMAALRHE